MEAHIHMSSALFVRLFLCDLHVDYKKNDDLVNKNSTTLDIQLTQRVIDALQEKYNRSVKNISTWSPIPNPAESLIGINSNSNHCHNLMTSVHLQPVCSDHSHAIESGERIFSYYSILIPCLKGPGHAIFLLDKLLDGTLFGCLI